MTTLTAIENAAPGTKLTIGKTVFTVLRHLPATDPTKDRHMTTIEGRRGAQHLLFTDHLSGDVLFLRNCSERSVLDINTIRIG